MKQIAVIRHPFDVLASVRSSDGSELNDRQLQLRRELYLGIMNVIKSQSEGCHVIRYEDLITNPFKELKAVLKYLGVKRDTLTVGKLVETANMLVKSIPGHVTSGDVQQSVGRWKRDFDDKDLIRKFHYYFDDVIQELDYE